MARTYPPIVLGQLSNPATDINGLYRDVTTLTEQVFNVEESTFGAVGDGSTNDDAAFNAAINAAVAVGGGQVYLPSPSYKVGTLHHQPGVTIRGAGSTPNGPISKLIGTSGQDVIDVPSSGANVGFGIEDLGISGGRHGFANFNNTGYTTYVRMRNVHISGGTGDCIHVEPSLIEEWYLDNVSLYGGQYGFYLNGGRFDKCRFTSVETKQQTKSSWYISVDTDLGVGASSSDVLWVLPIIHLPAEHGFVCNGGGTIRNWTFINPYCEGVGTSGKSNKTTGSITTGTATLTVASGTGFANSDPIVVRGAGTNGADLFTTISSGGGTTTLTLAANAATTVASLDVTNASFDEFFFDTPATAAYITFLNANLQGDAGGGHVRYSINGSGAVGNLVLENIVSSRPQYDPLRSVWAFGGSNVRQPNNFTSYNMNRTLFADPNTETIRTLVASPVGRDMVLALVDSLANGTGTLGNLEVRKNDSGKTRLLQLRGDTDALHTRGRIVANQLVGVIAFANADATPSVLAGNTFQTANAGATTITAFDDGTPGQIIKIRAADANTTVANNANIATNTGANKLLALDKMYTFTMVGAKWYEDE